MNPSSDVDPLALLADEFLDRHRRGEMPSFEEYITRHPELADRIREVFPALLVLENLGGSIAHGPPESPTSSASPIPRRLGEYKILRQVGRGGMGLVYEATQESLGRRVALKVLSPALAARGTFLERFRREAQTAAKLHHTNIVPVFGVGEADGNHYYAMQFIRGQGLDRVLRDVRRLRTAPPDSAQQTVSLAQSLITGEYEPLTDAESAAPPTTEYRNQANDSGSSHTLITAKSHYIREIARLGLQAAEALAYAHSQGVLHRDIKPSNLLLDTQGTLWVTDFGLAKAEESEDLTTTGEVVGTLRYMAPERLANKGDARSDVYGLGVTLYELLTLKPAFEETDRVRLIAQLNHGKVSSLRSFDPSIPRDLETIVLMAMAHDPADRYRTAAALAEDLRRFLSDRPVRARRQMWFERFWRWGRRNPGLAVLNSAVAILAFLLVIGSMLHSLRIQAALRESEERLFESYVAEARARRFSGRQGQRFATLEAIREATELAKKLGKPPEAFDELRTLAIAALGLPDLREEVLPVVPHKGDRWVVDLTQLKRVALLDKSGDVKIYRIADHSLIHQLEGKQINELLFEPNGRAIILLNEKGEVYRWNLVEQSFRFLFQTQIVPAGRWEICFNGNRILLVQNSDPDKRVEVYDLLTNQKVFTGFIGGEPGRSMAMRNVSISPEGDRLAMVIGAYGTETGRIIRITDIQSGKTIELSHSEMCANPKWYPDGRLLAVGLVDSSDVVVWDTMSSPPRIVHTIKDLRGGDPITQIGADGQLMVISSGWDGATVFFHPYRDTVLLRLLNSGGFYHPTHDGRMVTWHDKEGRLHLFIAEPSPVLRTLVADPSRVKPSSWVGPTIHPQGRLLAVGCAQGVSLFDLASGWDVGFIRAGAADVPHIVESNGDLLTNSSVGQYRWPITLSPNNQQGTVGPPHRLPFRARGGTHYPIISDRTGRVMAVSDRWRAFLWLESDRRMFTLTPLGDCRELMMTKNGRWLSTPCRDGGFFHIWDTKTGKQALKQEGSIGWFSPDDRFLSVAGKHNAFVRVGTWDDEPRPGWFSGGLPPFSPDDRLLITSTQRGMIHLHQASTGKRIATIEVPDMNMPWHSLFTPDGTYLILTSNETLRTFVWHLPALRGHLARLGLDWDSPAYPFSPTRFPEPMLPMKLDIQGNDIPGNPAKIVEHEKKLIATNLARNPNDAAALCRRGRLLVEDGDYAQAIKEMTRVLTLQPKWEEPRYIRALAAAHLKRWKDVVEDTTRILNANPFQDSARILRSRGNRNLKQYQEAVADLTDLLKRDNRPTLWREWRADLFDLLGDHSKAKADRDHVDNALAKDVAGLNQLAWRLVTGPEDQWNSRRADLKIQKAIKMNPGDHNLLNTRGVILYRMGRFEEAAEMLEKSYQGTRGNNGAFDQYFLAMCYNQLNQPKKASSSFERAEKWFKEQQSLSPEEIDELRSFQREARRILHGESWKK